MDTSSWACSIIKLTIVSILPTIISFSVIITPPFICDMYPTTFSLKNQCLIVLWNLKGLIHLVLLE